MDFDKQESIRKVTRLNEHLDRRFGITISLESLSYLRLVEEHYRSNREFIVARYGLAESLDREDYTKAVLISEAIGMYLREIAPNRTKPRTRKDTK